MHGGEPGRPALVAARKRLGMNQEQVAEAIGVSATTWARWERGDQGVRPVYRARMAAVFNVTPDEVERWISGCAHSAPFPWSPVWHENGNVLLAATVETATELWRWDVDPARRQMLTALPFVPEFLSEWLLNWSLDPAAESRAHNGRRASVSVGREDVRRLRDAAESFVRMDRQFGGGLVRPAVVDYLDTEVAPLVTGRYCDDVGAELMSAAACLSLIAGWEAYDLLRHGLAQVHYGQALRLAKAADDPLTGAWVLSILAQQTIDLRRPTWALRFARAARQAGEQVGACPRVRALLSLREARATALVVESADTHDTHTARRVHRLLGQAETAFGQVADGDDEPAWSGGLTAAELAAETGCAWRMIGDHVRAADCADRALRDFGAAFPRSVQLNTIYRARAALALDELDEALALARAAVPMAKVLTSLRVIQGIRTFDRELGPRTDEPHVREWREYLRSELDSGAV
jgi:transcriptional regulator with XRE-family HTH domain